jgi:hypothetical protein
MQQTQEQYGLPIVMSRDPTHWRKTMVSGAFPVLSRRTFPPVACIDHPLQLEARDDIRKGQVIELRFLLRVEDLIAGGKDDACRIDDDLLLPVLPPDGSRTADIVAEPALDTVLLVLDNDVGDRLRVGLVDRPADPYAGIEPVVYLDRADERAVAAAVAGRLVDISREFFHRHAEMTGLPLDLLHLREGMDGDVGIAGHIDHLG